MYVRYVHVQVHVVVNVAICARSGARSGGHVSKLAVILMALLDCLQSVQLLPSAVRFISRFLHSPPPPHQDTPPPPPLFLSRSTISSDFHRKHS